jgi:hypothetical protein
LACLIALSAQADQFYSAPSDGNIYDFAVKNRGDKETIHSLSIKEPVSLSLNPGGFITSPILPVINNSPRDVGIGIGGGNRGNRGTQ